MLLCSTGGYTFACSKTSAIGKQFCLRLIKQS